MCMSKDVRLGSGIKRSTSVIVISSFQVDLYTAPKILEQCFHFFPQRQWDSGKEKMYSIINGLSRMSSQLRRTTVQNEQLHVWSNFAEYLLIGRAGYTIFTRLRRLRVVATRVVYMHPLPLNKSQLSSSSAWNSWYGQLSKIWTFLLPHLVISLTYSPSVFCCSAHVKYGLFFHFVMISKRISSIVLDWHSPHLIKAS